MQHADSERLQAIWEAVEREPGTKPGTVARRLGLHRSSVTRALPALEEQGYLLSEDAKGRLWPWKSRG